jgi:hypothetical protein
MCIFLAMTKAELEASYKGWQRALPTPVVREYVHPFTKKTVVGKLYYPEESDLEPKARLKIFRRTVSEQSKRKTPTFLMDHQFVTGEDVESLLEIVAGKKLPRLRPARQLGSMDGHLFALPAEAKPALGDLTDHDIERCAATLSKAIKPRIFGPSSPQIWTLMLDRLRTLAKEARSTRRSLYYEMIIG